MDTICQTIDKSNAQDNMFYNRDESGMNTRATKVYFAVLSSEFRFSYWAMQIAQLKDFCLLMQIYSSAEK